MNRRILGVCSLSLSYIHSFLKKFKQTFLSVCQHWINSRMQSRDPATWCYWCENGLFPGWMSWLPLYGDWFCLLDCFPSAILRFEDVFTFDIRTTFLLCSRNRSGIHVCYFLHPWPFLLFPFVFRFVTFRVAIW